MTDNRDTYQNVLRNIDNHENWVFDTDYSGSNIEEVAEAAVESEGFYRFNHEDNDSVITGRIPDLGSEDGVIKAWLEQPLDRAIDSVEEDFSSGLADTQYEIADGNVGEYISPCRDPRIIAEFEVPGDYSETKLNESLNRLSNISVEVDDLHSDLIDLIE